jgi:hypothetical protein
VVVVEVEVVVVSGQFKQQQLWVGQFEDDPEPKQN